MYRYETLEPVLLSHPMQHEALVVVAAGRRLAGAGARGCSIH
jgi:hypothetical protein